MAEWLCRGLQILVQRFDSASGLHNGTMPRFFLERALIPGSSVVEQAAVNRWVDGSNPSRGARPPLLRSKTRPMDKIKQPAPRPPRTRERAARRKAKLRAKRRRQRA